jgi:hypothetical protein
MNLQSTKTMKLIPAVDGPPSSDIPSKSNKRWASALKRTVCGAWLWLKQDILLKPQTAFAIWVLVMIAAGKIQHDKTNTSSGFVFGYMFFALLFSLISWLLFYKGKLKLFGLVTFKNYGSKYGEYTDSKFRHPVFIAWYVVIFPIATQLTYGVFSYNRAGSEADTTAKILIDGKPLVDTDTHWFLPWRHDVKIIPLDATADWKAFESMTKDGKKLFAEIKVHLRRHDDPKSWKLTSDTVPSRKDGIQACLDEICSRLTAEEIDNDALIIEREIAHNEGARLEELLPKEVLLDGLIEVKNVEAHPYIKKKSKSEHIN